MTPLQPSADNPSRGVVDEAAVERACAGAASVDGIDWSNPEWQAAHRIEVGRLRSRMRAALQAAALPADTVTVQEAWEWAGGNPGITATRADLEAALRDLDAVCDEADAALPAVPDGVIVMPNEPTEEMLRRFWHVCNGASEWLAAPMPLTKKQLARAKKAYSAMLAATPAHDQPEGDR